MQRYRRQPKHAFYQSQYNRKELVKHETAEKPVGDTGGSRTVCDHWTSSLPSARPDESVNRIPVPYLSLSFHED